MIYSIVFACTSQPSKVKKFKLDTMMFEEIFAGPVPQFEFSEIKVKKTAVKKPESRDVSPGPSKKAKDKEGAGIHTKIYVVSC